MRTHAEEIPDMPGTGGELAKHLVERFKLSEVKVEQGEHNQNHYSPTEKCIRLSPENFQGKSLTAIAVAAHEVGHAIQFHREEPLSKLRGKYLPLSMSLGKIGTSMLFALPIVTVALPSPATFIAFIGFSLLLQLAGAAMYLIILPEEFDASFNKALPILSEGDYLPKHMLPSAHKVLKAAALTYCAAALANVLNIGRWFMIFLKR
jgi:Zn-dependent membrane protease YugP